MKIMNVLILKELLIVGWVFAGLVGLGTSVLLVAAFL